MVICEGTNARLGTLAQLVRATDSFFLRGYMKFKLLNGYRIVYMPDHPSAFKGSGYKGYVYEHVYFIEKELGRQLVPGEEVHHLDMNRLNNRLENLIVISESQHAKLHAFLRRCGFDKKLSNEHRMNSEKTNPVCEHCGLTLQYKQERFCSIECKCCYEAERNKRPTLDHVYELSKTMSKEAIGRMYGVTGKAVAKWLAKYHADMSTLSQAEGTPSEGAETSGEVQSS